jgi:ABC-type antimicrobial peptide transport system permease subunit
LAVALAGIVVGLLVFAGAARFLRTMLFGVSAWDPTTIAGAAATLMVISLAAAWLPARRAAYVDPAQALRGE